MVFFSASSVFDVIFQEVQFLAGGNFLIVPQQREIPLTVNLVYQARSFLKKEIFVHYFPISYFDE